MYLGTYIYVCTYPYRRVTSRYVCRMYVKGSINFFLDIFSLFGPFPSNMSYFLFQSYIFSPKVYYLNKTKVFGTWWVFENSLFVPLIFQNIRHGVCRRHKTLLYSILPVVCKLQGRRKVFTMNLRAQTSKGFTECTQIEMSMYCQWPNQA